MLYREIIAVCSDIQARHINTLCEQNVEFVNIELGGTYSVHWVANPQFNLQKLWLELCVPWCGTEELLNRATVNTACPTDWNPTCTHPPAMSSVQMCNPHQQNPAPKPCLQQLIYDPFYKSVGMLMTDLQTICHRSNSVSYKALWNLHAHKMFARSQCCFSLR